MLKDKSIVFRWFWLNRSACAIWVGMIKPAQCRAARALLDWSQQQLADAAKVGVVTVRQFEGGLAQPRNATLDVLSRALETAGVIFVAENGEGPGVRLRKERGPGSKEPAPADEGRNDYEP